MSSNFLSTTRGKLILLLVCGVAFLDFVDASIVNVALPDIRTALDFSNQGLQWVPSGYLLTYGGFMLLGGRAADLFGRRRVLVVGTIVFALACVAGGFADDAGTLVGARLVQGVGAAMMLPAALSLLTTTFHEGADRTRALGAWGAVAGLASAVGVLAGGLLTSGPGWRWVMFVNPPFCVLILVGAARLLEDDREPVRTRGLDLLGAFLVTAGMLLLVFALVKAPDQGWGSGRTVGELTAAAALLVAFVVNEARVANPLLPLSIFRIRGLAAADVTQLVAVAGFGAMFFFLTLYMQNVLGWSPIKTGLALPAGDGRRRARRGRRAADRAAGRDAAGGHRGLLIAATGVFLLSGIPVAGSYASDLLARHGRDVGRAGAGVRGERDGGQRRRAPPPGRPGRGPAQRLAAARRGAGAGGLRRDRGRPDERPAGRARRAAGGLHPGVSAGPVRLGGGAAGRGGGRRANPERAERGGGRGAGGGGRAGAGVTGPSTQDPALHLGLIGSEPGLGRAGPPCREPCRKTEVPEICYASDFGHTGYTNKTDIRLQIQSRAQGGVLSSDTDEITHEQENLTLLYDRLDGLRSENGGRLADVLAAPGGTPQQRTERDGLAASLAERAARLDAAEHGLCFGRLTMTDGERLYIGRLGMLADDESCEPLLVDWRAPAARPFYVATAAAPEGVRRRRHIRTRFRSVVGLEDDVLDLGMSGNGRDGIGGSGSDSADGLVGEGALLAALTAGRTGRMRDVVETIQAEQDRAIRAAAPGVLVVQGGPGTGKTAVALHRAAYLLYTYRERLSRTGVLIVGPSSTFLRYISQVLPALGETSAVLRTLPELAPGTVADRAESSEVAEVKGRAVMAEVVAAAVRNRQSVPDEPVKLDFEGHSYLLTPEAVERAGRHARRAHRLHNDARPAFERALLDTLAGLVTDRLNEDPFEELTRGMAAAIAEDLGVEPDELADEGFLDADSRADIAATLGEEPAVRRLLDELWPALTPQQLIAGLFGSEDVLRAAAGALLAEDEWRPLLREPGGFTPADVPLLDEAAELLGDVDTGERARAERVRRERIEFAQGVLDVSVGSQSIDLEDPREEITTAADLLSAEDLADRHEFADVRSVAERAAADRRWTYGHVVVDEAQELSAMAWRMLMRRCPTRSMTLVGDVAQTGDPAGAASWGATLAPFVGDRWRLAELTVNYRTPAEIMALAAEVLAKIDPGLEPPRSVREAGQAPWEEAVSAAALAARVAEVAAREDAALGGQDSEDAGSGRLAVLVPASLRAEVAAAVTAAVPDAAFGDNPDLERRTVVLTVRQAKGLEFDTVVLVDPDRIAAEGPRGTTICTSR